MSESILSTWVTLCRVWKKTASKTLNSRFHMDVSEKLTFMGIAHEDEKLTEDGCFSIDIALEGPRGPVAIEVDGPYHFTVNTFNPLGPTLIRCTILSLKSWKKFSSGSSCVALFNYF